MSSAEIRAKISALQKKRDEYIRRQNAVQKVQKVLNGQFDDDISQARKQNEQITGYLERGLEGGSLTVFRLCEQIDAVKEKQIWSDSDLSTASTAIDAENGRCGSEISRLNSEISSLQIQLAAALRAEAAAAAARQ